MLERNSKVFDMQTLIISLYYNPLTNIYLISLVISIAPDSLQVK